MKRLQPLFSLLFLLLLFSSTTLQAQRKPAPSGKLEKSTRLPGLDLPTTKKVFDHFDYETPTYSATNAYLSMLAARECYLDVVGARNEAEFRTKILPTFIGWGLLRVNVITNARTSTECIVASNDKMVLIAFRGSEFSAPPTTINVSLDINGWRSAGSIQLPNVLTEAAVKDWIATDAHISQMSGSNWSSTRVHTGFATALESVLDQIMADLEKPQVGAGVNGSKPIFITGHSLGGALASLCAFRLARRDFPVKAVYLHAAPKVGDITFSAKYASLRIPTFRIQNQQDIVPDFPSSKMVEKYNQGVQNKAALNLKKVNSRDLITSYNHPTSVLKYISRDGSIFTNPSAETVQRDQGLVPSFSDHNSFLYCLRLYNALSREEQRGLIPPQR